MMQNFDQSIEWLVKDETGPEAKALKSSVMPKLLERDYKDWLKADYWDPLLLDYWRSGLDYYLFDLSFRFSPRLVRWWVERITGECYEDAEKALCCISVPDAIAHLDHISRENLKSRKDWFINKHWWTNRANRPRSRAVKLSEGVEVDEA